MKNLINKIHHTDCREFLDEMPANKIDCAITSPPYFALRDYGLSKQIWDGLPGCIHDWIEHRTHRPNQSGGKSKMQKGNEGSFAVDYKDRATYSDFCNKCGAWRGSLGLEPDFNLYVKHLCDVFTRLKRPLKDTGSLWVNMGTTYGRVETQMISDKDRSWLAALIDGEGSIQIHKQKRDHCVPSYQADISVGMIDDQMIKKAHSITNLGSVGLQNRGVWDWSVRGQEAGILAQIIYPDLLIKKQQAKILIALCNNTKAKKNGKFVKPENLKYREILFNIIHKLNQRVNINIELPEPKPVLKYSNPKCDLLIPERFAIEMVSRGWILRSKIIWHKTNCMPSSIKDRFTVDYEVLLFFTQNKNYYFKTQYEPCKDGTAKRMKHSFGGVPGEAYPAHEKRKHPHSKTWKFNPKGRIKRCVWTISTKPSRDKHFASYPEGLITTPILAACPPKGIVYDPFCGTGSTCAEAKKLGRNYIGNDLKKEYVDISKRRMQ